MIDAFVQKMTKFDQIAPSKLCCNSRVAVYVPRERTVKCLNRSQVLMYMYVHLNRIVYIVITKSTPRRMHHLNIAFATCFVVDTSVPDFRFYLS